MGVKRLKEIEDLLFALRPKVAEVFQDFVAMANTPSDLSPEEEYFKLLEKSPPDFGLIIPELDTDEDREERERVQAKYDTELEAARYVAEEKKVEREELDQSDMNDAAEERISKRVFIRELERRGYNTQGYAADARTATDGLWSVIHPADRIPAGLLLEEFVRLRAHKLRRIIMDGPTKQLKLVLVRHGEADFLADKVVAERQRPLTEQGILQAATAGQNMAIAKCNPDLILCSNSQRCLETAQWIQELAPREYAFSTSKALDQKEDPLGRLGPSIFPVADTIISAAEARPDIFTVCLLSHGMLLETIASCLTFQSDDVRERCVNRLLCGDVVILQSKPLTIAEGEDLDERPAADLWTEAMRSERWSITEHLRGDGVPDPPEPRHVDDSTKQWYHHTTDTHWVNTIGDPLIYTEENTTMSLGLNYSNKYVGLKEPQAHDMIGSLRLLVDGWVSPQNRTPREDEDRDKDGGEYGSEDENGGPDVSIRRSSLQLPKEESKMSSLSSDVGSYRQTLEDDGSEQEG